MAELSLAKGFEPAGEAAWRALVEDALRGTPFAALTAKTYDGIAIEPLYGRAGEARPIAGRAPGLPWSAMQRIDHPDAKAANAQIRDDLTNGANGVALVFEGAVGDHGYALGANGTAISAALDEIYLDAGIAIDLDLGLQSKDAAGLLATLVKARAIAPNATTIRFGFDPLGAIALSGASPLPWKDIGALLAGLVADLAGQGFAGPFAAADGRAVHAAGGSEAQELAFALASAIAYLRALEQGGIALEDAASLIYFRLAADQDQFLTIAKFRAIRKLWARIAEACGLKPRPAFVSAETAWRMMTKRDPHGNIVRGTIAALGAAAGGADAVAVLPVSAALGLPDAFARRIARNTQTILIEEANIHRVADPAAGSGAIEALTDALAEAAWGLFQETECEGGLARALETGAIQQGVAKVRAARQTNIARRTDSLVGTSDFPDLDETEAAVLRLCRRRETGCGRRDRPSRSSVCATEATSIARSMAQGRKCFSPVSGAPPTSMRDRVSPKACSRRAASKRSKAMAATSRNDSRNRARSSPASAPPTRSTRRRPKPPPRRSNKRARSASISPGEPAPTRPRSSRPALAAFFIKAVIRLQF